MKTTPWYQRPQPVGKPAEPDTPEYRSWFYMKDRFWKQVCPRWKKFENFLADMGPRPPHHSLNRLDKRLPFGPGNCQWIDYSRGAGNWGIPWEERYAKRKSTPEWKVASALAMERAKGRCQVCNSPDQLCVHHRSYQHVGLEHPDDLTVLCARCHDVFHRNGIISDHVIGEDVTVKSRMSFLSEGDMKAGLGHGYSGPQPNKKRMLF